MSYKIPGGQDLSAIFQPWTSPSPQASPTGYLLNGADLCTLFASRISTTVLAPLTNYEVNNANYNNKDLNSIFEAVTVTPTFDSLYSSWYSNTGVVAHSSMKTFENFSMPAGKTGFKFMFCGGGGNGCTVTSTTTGSGGGGAFIQTQFPFNAPSGGSYITSIVITFTQFNTAGRTYALQVNYSNNSVLQFSATGGGNGGTAAGTGGTATKVSSPTWWPASNTQSATQTTPAIFYRSIPGPAGAVNGGPGQVSSGQLITTGTSVQTFHGAVSGAASTTSGSITQLAKSTTTRPYIFSSASPIPIGSGGGKNSQNLGVPASGYGCGGASVDAGWAGIAAGKTAQYYTLGSNGVWMFILV
jgi:hypothetical protein